MDIFAETLMSAVTLRCYTWLRSTALQQDTKAYIEDLSFEGEGLFSTIIDIVLQELDESIKTSRIREYLHLPVHLRIGPGPGHDLQDLF